MAVPTSETSGRIKKAAKLRVEGASWEKIAIRYRYKTADSARKTLQGEYPDLWREAFEHARELYLDEIESEALLTQRDLIRPVRADDSPRDERIRQSAAHSLLVHAARMRAKKLEISGPGGGPVSLAQVHNQPAWAKKRKEILKALEGIPAKKKTKIMKALLNDGSAGSRS